MVIAGSEDSATSGKQVVEDAIETAVGSVGFAAAGSSDVEVATPIGLGSDLEIGQVFVELVPEVAVSGSTRISAEVEESEALFILVSRWKSGRKVTQSR